MIGYNPGNSVQIFVLDKKACAAFMLPIISGVFGYFVGPEINPSATPTQSAAMAAMGGALVSVGYFLCCCKTRVVTFSDNPQTIFVQETPRERLLLNRDADVAVRQDSSPSSGG